MNQQAYLSYCVHLGITSALGSDDQLICRVTNFVLIIMDGETEEATMIVY